MPSMADSRADVDVLIVGAGLSGIAAAYFLRTKVPAATYAILEGRDAIGGTWDLFRYPGVRSDSDMHTLGYSFRPWRGAKSIVGGDEIAAYIRETARAYGIDRAIRFGHRVVRAAWSSANARWTVDVQAGPEATPVLFTCRFLFMCSGYYDYAGGYLPAWPEMERFRGRLVHPQQWPADFDYTGKRVLVIGSGATAVTLVPGLAEQAAHVTMLQRSPTYVVARPSETPLVRGVRRMFPAQFAGAFARWYYVLFMMYSYHLARRQPERVKAAIVSMARAQLGPAYDVATHFTPNYNPWDQRLCLAADGDLFAALRAGTASIVTGEIERFTETGVQLRSGEALDADAIVAATGLSMKLMGGVDIVVDGAAVDLSHTMSYKGMMFTGIPNLALCLGYTNASWTLKSELVARYVCRLIKYMDAHGYAMCVARRNPAVPEEPAIGLTSGYVRRAEHLMPKQGTRRPWKLHQNYALDLAALRFGRLRDGVIEFIRAPSAPAA
jgi:cation diffusion facilitator CzcD-associated flavoprotein CzcO